MEPLCTHDTMIMVIILGPLGPFLKSILDQIIQIIAKLNGKYWTKTY